MKIGIDITSALKSQRTGVEEYTYQLITHMLALDSAREHEFFLFSSAEENNPFEAPMSIGAKGGNNLQEVSKTLGKLPQNTRIVYSPYRPMWHQIILPSLVNKIKPDIFFSPAHPLPIRWSSVGIPGVATIHGVEWERVPWAYLFLQRQYLRWTTKKTIQNAKGIIAISEHTKRGIEEFFPTETPIKIIHHGMNMQQNTEYRIQNTGAKNILFIGRKDKRKNIKGITEAFHILREKTSISFTINIVGPRGNDTFASSLQDQLFNNATLININRFITDQEKEIIYQNSDILLFPSFDEGFGMPILEAQSHGIPVIASSFLQEIGGEGAIYCDPARPESIAESLLKIMSNKILYGDMQRKARENSMRFTWGRCAGETLEFIEQKGIY
ncbi:MAG: glycosyltransferase family 4 protein [Candidatus Spechtbacteria bacterium]|nr:glycosyltransferase family 4 protein [Candidatus Spechtbacteria bacterium]